MSKDKKVLSQEEIKKRQNKIICTTRIIGVVIFLIGISIIFITAFIRGKYVAEPVYNNSVEFESASDSFYLYDYDKKLLKNDYFILKSSEDYNNFLIDLDNWYQENYNNYVSQINNGINLDEENKISEIDDYRTVNDQRYFDIKDLLVNMKITYETFNDKFVIVVEDITSDMVLNEHYIEDICLDGDNLNIHLSKEVVGVVADRYTSLYFIELDKSYIDKNIVIDVNSENDSNPNVDYKPIIYIYPEEETDVKVKLNFEDKLLVSYPIYNNYWSVRANSDGKLVDNKTGRELYSLYYESLNNVEFKVEEDGFVVSSEEIIPFLESKLEILGLNYKESEEFIIYWLPILKENKYNYIRFATMEEINENTPIDIEPKPDTFIRVLMTFKGLNEKISVREQELNKVVRTGYSVVEWGGTIIE